MVVTLLSNIVVQTLQTVRQFVFYHKDSSTLKVDRITLISTYIKVCVKKGLDIQVYETVKKITIKL